ncbi:hypothetical protein ACA910_009884 [Epithemia clementina (nom. ined.)]
MRASTKHVDQSGLQRLREAISYARWLLNVLAWLVEVVVATILNVPFSFLCVGCPWTSYAITWLYRPIMSLKKKARVNRSNSSASP